MKTLIFFYRGFIGIFATPFCNLVANPLFGSPYCLAEMTEIKISPEALEAMKKIKPGKDEEGECACFMGDKSDDEKVPVFGWGGFKAVINTNDCSPSNMWNPELFDQAEVVEDIEIPQDFIEFVENECLQVG